MWSKAWVLPRVSLSGLFIYSQNQSPFWRLYLIRLSLSLGWKNRLNLQPFRMAPPRSLSSCHSVSVCFPSSRWTLWGKHFFFKFEQSILHVYVCACLSLCVPHICRCMQKSEDPVQWNWYSQAVNCLQQELEIKYEFSAGLSWRQGLWVQADCRSAIFPALPSKSRHYRRMPLQLPNCRKFLFVIIGQMMWNDRSVSPPSSFSFGFFCDLFLNVIASMWLKPGGILNALE